MQGSEYKSVQNEYLAWIDVRIRSGATVAKMNEELISAGLILKDPELVDAAPNIEKNTAGYLAEISMQPPGDAGDLRALTFGIHAGSSCGFDNTIVLYQGTPQRRVARINADDSHKVGFHLLAVTFGKDDPNRGSLIASAWVVSNCTSNWNGKAFRIDHLRGQSFEGLLDRGVGAFGDEVKISIENDTVTFDYETSIRDTSILIREAVARYVVQGSHAIRQAPIAPSYGGFIDEWFEVSDTEAARWSGVDAARRHHDLVAQFGKGFFVFEHVASCPGSSPTREIAVRWKESNQATVFLISGSSAAEMGMEAISDTRNPSCREIDIKGDLTSVMNEPAR